jgi:hypothetical protein
LYFGVGKNSREDGERGDGHGYTDEQSKRGEGNFAAGETPIEPKREARAQEKRHNDAGMRNGDGSPSALPQQIGVEFQADQEHEQDDANLGDDGQKRCYRQR